MKIVTTKKNIVVKGRPAARLAAVQALYQLEQEPTTPQKVIVEFLNYRFTEVVDNTKFITPDKSLFEDIVIGVMDRMADLDSMISSTLSEDWRIERMESVVRAILRAAVFELSRDTSVPVPVVINEYIEITKSFCTGPEVAFVNASLDALAKLLRTADLQE
ncbi:MAG: transcription antitermination factor NusB [Alphaproteobacteria bacterium]|nr:transcription antitermination factor NusB [Alphaproteobacteria bacterium]